MRLFMRGVAMVAFRHFLPREHCDGVPVRLAYCNRRCGHEGACHADAFGMKILAARLPC